MSKLGSSFPRVASGLEMKALMLPMRVPREENACVEDKVVVEVKPAVGDLLDLIFFVYHFIQSLPSLRGR